MKKVSDGDDDILNLDLCIPTLGHDGESNYHNEKKAETLKCPCRHKYLSGTSAEKLAHLESCQG